MGPLPDMGDPAADPAPQRPETQRFLFIDQCRGYAIFGMILVNVLGVFDAMPWMLKHHRIGFSYADHIAPLFIFVVGMGFRMSYIKIAARAGTAAARKRALRRYAILMGMGLVGGGFHLRAAVWDALLDIGAAGMIALPFMGCKAPGRVVVAVACLALYQLLYSTMGYGEWVLNNSINGGPLGPLSWAFILLMGTLAHDLIQSRHGSKALRWLLACAIVLSATGWVLRMEWPGVKTFWPFTQFGMTASYSMYASGLCFLTLFLFYLLCERLRIQLPHLSTLGRNPLALYILQAILVGLMRLTVDTGVPASMALSTFVVIYALCYGAARYLERTGRYIKV